MQRVYAQSDAKSLFCFGARPEPARWRIEGATGLLYSNAIGSFHGFIGKSVFYANIDADHRRLDRNGGNESLEHSLRFQLGCRFCGGMRKQPAPLTCASLRSIIPSPLSGTSPAPVTPSDASGSALRRAQ
jgi:hypothetical protein